MIKEENTIKNENLYNIATFDERKEDYLKELRKNLYLFNQYNVTYHDDKNEMMKILLNPKDELELEFCKAMITYVQDIDYMIGSDLEFDYDNSLYLKCLTEFYNLYKNSKLEEKSEEVINKYNNPKALAKITYELLCIGINEMYDFIEVFAEKNNINLDDELELQIINTCIEEIKQKNTKKDLSKEEEMKISIEFFKELHNEVTNRLKNNEKRK